LSIISPLLRVGSKVFTTVVRQVRGIIEAWGMWANETCMSALLWLLRAFARGDRVILRFWILRVFQQKHNTGVFRIRKTIFTWHKILDGISAVLKSFFWIFAPAYFCICHRFFAFQVMLVERCALANWLWRWELWTLFSACASLSFFWGA